MTSSLKESEADDEEIEEMEQLESIERVSVLKNNIDPYDVVTNVIRIFTTFSSLILEINSSEYPIGSSQYINNVIKKGKVCTYRIYFLFILILNFLLKEFSKSMENMRDPQKLEMWIWPLQPWQTSLVSTKSKAMIQDLDQISLSLEEYVASHASSDPAKKAVMSDIRYFLNDLQMFYYCMELSTAEIINAQIESLSYYMKSVIESATITQDLEAYDIIARICTTESIKLGRLCCMKGILQFNVEHQKELSELSYSIIRAIKLLIVVGRSIVEDNSNISIKKNLVALATGLVKYFTRVSTLASNHEENSNYVFTSEVVERCISLYDSAIKEMLDALLKYKSSPSCDMMVVGLIQQLVGEVKLVQATFLSSYSKTLMISVLRITKYIELLCAHVYLRLTDETDEILKDMLMNGMYSMLHNCIQLNLAACSKAVQHPILPQEITILSCIRSMFVTLSVLLINACPLVLEQTQTMNKELFLQVNSDKDYPPEIEKAIINILHYGRELILTQNPFIVVEYNEKKDIDDVFRDVESELFDEKEILEPPIKHTESFRNIDLRTNRTLSMRMQNVNSPSHSVSMKDLKTKPSQDYINAMETSLHRRTLLLKRNESNAELHKKTSERISYSQFRIQETGNSRKNSFVKETNEEIIEIPKQQDKEVKTETTTENSSSNKVVPWTDIPADEINENNLPEGYPKPPPIPVYNNNGSEEEYKQYMIQRYEREQWENALIVYKRKLKEQQQLAKV